MEDGATYLASRRRESNGHDGFGSGFVLDGMEFLSLEMCVFVCLLVGIADKSSRRYNEKSQVSPP